MLGGCNELGVGNRCRCGWKRLSRRPRVAVSDSNLHAVKTGHSSWPLFRATAVSTRTLARRQGRRSRGRRPPKPGYSLCGTRQPEPRTKFNARRQSHPGTRGGSYVCLPSVCRLSATVWGLRVDEGIDEGRRGYLPLISNTLPLHSLAPDFKHFAPSFKLCP
jgi:hypothetical protein